MPEQGGIEHVGQLADKEGSADFKSIKKQQWHLHIGKETFAERKKRKMPEIEAIAAAGKTSDRGPSTDFFKKAPAPAAQAEHCRTEKAVNHEAVANHEGIIDRQKEG